MTEIPHFRFDELATLNEELTLYILAILFVLVRPLYHLAFFRYLLLYSVTFEFRTEHFIQSTTYVVSISFSHDLMDWNVC